MKRVLPFLLIFLAGCIVQSFYPFYTEKSKVALPQLNGEWDAVVAFGENQDATNVPPWQISGDQITAFDPDSSQPSRIHVVFFKVGGQLFCDSMAGKLDDKQVPWYWVWHVCPVHTVTKVEMIGNVLIFRPLDLDWLTDGVAKGKLSLLHIARAEPDNRPLFTASPSDWEKFLKKYANDTDAFPTNHVYVLKRHVTTPAK
jgi:hypothetical protein